MASHVFYPSLKKIPTGFTAYIEGGLLLPLKGYVVWILYANGRWILYDLVRNQILNEGKIDGPIDKYSHIMCPPAPLGDKEIVFANFGLEKIQVLNPFGNKYDENWHLEVPTNECVPENEREDLFKMTDATNEVKILVLQKTQTVVVCEKKDSNQGQNLVTVIRRGVKDRLQAVHNCENKTYLFTKVDDSDKILLYSDYTAGGSIDFAIWDLSKPAQGFVNYSIGKSLGFSIIQGGEWDKDTICFVGNPDASGIPEIHLTDYKKKETENEPLDYLGEDALLTEVLFINPKKKKILCHEQGSGDEAILALYDIKYKRLDFKMSLDTSVFAYESSPDRKYFVEYESAMAGEVDENTPGNTELKVYSLVNKKIFLLFLMKKAKLEVNGEKISLLKYYGHPYVAQQVADMFSA